MKKIIILLSSVVSIVVLGQHSCGFDHRRALMDKEHPESKISRERAEQEFMRKGVNGILREYGFISEKPIPDRLTTMSTRSYNYTGQIYDIPVVVHIIESSNEADAQLKVTDDEVRTWIENANKMYATNYGNGFFEEGSGAKGGNIIPFRLVLAKRSPDCEATSGIIRYDGSSIVGYNEYGMKDAGNDGAEEADIRRLAPHWPESSYYNIYIVTSFDGNKTDYGLMGWAYGPEVSDRFYETVMKAPVIKKKNDTTLAHEFGHSLGLAHPFATGSETSCPISTGDCSVDDDKVCDTEPSKSLGGVNVPTENDINPCTNKYYEGVQYNIMNYTFQPRKFTAGQRDRALAMFLSQKGSLVKSLAGKELENNNINLSENACVINASDNPSANFYIGITRVQLGDIDVESASYSGNGRFYSDYTKACHSIAYTDIIEGKEVFMTISKPSVNKQEIVAWIDYNDNGIFEDDEKIINGIRMEDTESSKTFTFTPPASAVKDKYLRMRVRGDWTARTSCANAQYGEIEDYAVRIVSENFVEPTTQNINTDGRVGINTEEPKATLDVRETTDVPESQPQGVLFPNFTSEQRATFQGVAEGTMIFNTTLKCLEIYSDGAWKCLN